MDDAEVLYIGLYEWITFAGVPTTMAAFDGVWQDGILIVLVNIRTCPSSFGRGS